MKKLLLSLIIIFAPLAGWASLQQGELKPLSHPTDIPPQYASSSETAVMEWGCPVAEIVKAENQSEALQQIVNACMEQVRKEATNKPGVFEVIEASVIWPDVQVSEESTGFRLQGTFFIETLVLQDAEGTQP